MKRKPKSAIQSDTQVVLDGIRTIVKSLRQASKRTEKQMGLSAAQLFVLQRISESDQPLSINDLAEKTLTHQSSVSVVVAKLVKQKLVERLPSKADARVAELSLSKKGTALLRQCPPLIQERLMSAVAHLSPEVRNGLVVGIQALIEKAGLQEEAPSLFFEEGKEVEL